MQTSRKGCSMRRSWRRENVSLDCRCVSSRFKSTCVFVESLTRDTRFIWSTSGDIQDIQHLPTALQIGFIAYLIIALKGEKNDLEEGNPIMKVGRMSIRRCIMNKQVKTVKHWHQVFTLAQPRINNGDTNMRKRNRLCNRTLKVLATSPPTNRRVSLPAGRAETIPQSIFDICGTVISFFFVVFTL